MELSDLDVRLQHRENLGLEGKTSGLPHSSRVLPSSLSDLFIVFDKPASLFHV